MKTVPLFLILTTALLASVQGQTSDSATANICAPPYPVIAGASTGAGFMNFCVSYPQEVQPGSTFLVSSIFTAPNTVLPVFPAATAAFTANAGCTEGTPVQLAPTTNGVLGTMVSYATTFTLTGEQCDFTAFLTLTVAAVPIQIYNTGITALVRTENVRIDNFNYLCNAPAIAPNAYSTTATTCSTPQLNNYNFLCDAPGATPAASPAATTTCNDLALTGTLTLTGIPDTQQEIQAIADALSSGLDVEICPETTPCFLVADVADDTTDDGVLSVPPASISNVSVNGSFPSAFTADVDLTDLGDTDGLGGIDVSFLILAWLVALVWCLRQAKLFAALAALVGIACVLIPGPDWITWVGVLFFTLALWLEAVAREKLPYHWFNGTKPT